MTAQRFSFLKVIYDPAEIVIGLSGYEMFSLLTLRFYHLVFCFPDYAKEMVQMFKATLRINTTSDHMGAARHGKLE